MKKGLNFQLGLMVGEYIVLTSLPTLSTDMLKTNNVIQVDEELTEEWERKGEKYDRVRLSKGEKSTELFYQNLKWYKDNIEAKYLDNKIEVLVPNITPTDNKEFFEGLDSALWDCDCSHYGKPRFTKEKGRSWAQRRGIKLTKTQHNFDGKI